MSHSNAFPTQMVVYQPNNIYPHFRSIKIFILDQNRLFKRIGSYCYYVLECKQYFNKLQFIMLIPVPFRGALIDGNNHDSDLDPPINININTRVHQ